MRENKDLNIAAEDLEHHFKVIGTTGGDIDTSPVGCVKRGVFPIEHLDRFTEKSSFFDSIQQFRATQNK